MAEKLEAEITLGYREFAAGVDQAVKVSQKLESGVGQAMDQTEARAKAALASLTNQLKVVGTEFSGFAQKATEAANKIDLKELESRFAGIAKTGAAAFSATLQAGGNFEEGLLRINTIAGLSQDELAGLGESLKNVGKEIGVSASPTATLASYYDVLSSGFTKTADATAVLSASLKLATGGQAEASDTTRALTGVLNAYGDSSEKAQLRADQFFQTVNLGVTTVPELSKSLGLVTSTAASAGVSFEELSAAIATATLRGQTSSAAIEGIRGTIASLITPTAGAQKELARLGIVVDANSLKQKGLLATLQEINAATGGNVDSINKIIEGQVGLATALSLSRDGGTLFAQNLEQIAGASGATQKALNEVNKGVNEAGRTFQSSVERLKISASQAALPVQNTLIRALTGLVDIVDAAPQPVKTTGIALIGLGTAAAAAASGMAGLALVLPVITGQLTALGARGLPLASAAFAALNIPVGLAIKNLYGFVAGLARQAVAAGASVLANATLAGSFAGVNAAIVGATGLLSGLGLGLIAIPAAVGVAIAAYTQLQEEVNAANESMLKSEDLRKNGRNVKGNVTLSNTDLLSSDAKSLAARGVTLDDITQRVIDQEKAAEVARDQANGEQERKANERAKRLRRLRTELAAELDRLAGESKKSVPSPTLADPKEEEKARKERARKEKEEYNERFRNELQVMEHSKESHELKIQHYRDMLKVYEQDGNKRRTIEDKIAEEQKKILEERKRAFQEQAKEDIQNAEVKDDGQRLKNLQELAKKYRDNGDIRRQIEDKIAVVEDRLQKKKEDNIKRLQDLKKDAADQEIQDAESQIDKLQRLQDRGTDTTEQQKAQLRKSADAAKQKVDVELEEKTAKTDSAGTKAAQANASREKLRIEEAYQQQVQALDERSTQDRLQRASDLNATELDLVNQRIEMYRELAKAGGASESQIRAEIEERYKLQIKAIELQEQQVKAATDDAEKIRQAERAATIAKVQAENEKQRAIEGTTEALKVQKKEQQSATSLNLGGGPYSLDQFFQNQSGFLDLNPTKGGANPKELARQRRVLDAMNASTSPAEVKKAVDAGNASALAKSAGGEIRRLALAIDLYRDGEKIPSKVRKATVDGKGAEVEEAGRNL